MTATTKPSGFSVRDILELPEVKPANQGSCPKRSSPLPRALDLSDVTIPALCYGGLCPDTNYSRWLASEIIPAYAALRKYRFLISLLTTKFHDILSQTRKALCVPNS